MLQAYMTCMCIHTGVINVMQHIVHAVACVCMLDYMLQIKKSSNVILTSQKLLYASTCLSVHALVYMACVNALVYMYKCTCLSVHALVYMP